MSKFFSLGQVIETVRGGGIFQPAIDDAIRKLGEGEWVGRTYEVPVPR
jgi:monolysocardiolipin acyltransferase